MHKLLLLGLAAALPLGAAADLVAATPPVGISTDASTGALIGAAAGSATGPWIGSWTLISAVSTLDPPNKLSIASVHGAVHVAMSGETRFDFTANPDGHETAVPGNPAFNRIALHRIGKTQTEIKEMKDGVPVATVRDQLSKDGKELTITTTTAGQADKITVWTRTGGAKPVGDPFAGEWTQDLGKTHLRQGQLLKIEAEGNGGVRFSGEFSYTARFDGKPYDVKNSRNDTVTLQLVDPHTVDAIYRRDDQQTQQDRWIISADGQQMTLTTTGTFVTGQRIDEKLIFKRQ